MRPIYETEKDLKNERSLADILCKKWRCKLQKLQPRDSFDYAAIRDGKVIAFIEMKNRNNEIGKYDTYMISMSKLLHAHNVRNVTDIVCVLAVRWTDAIGWVMFDRKRSHVTMGGRFDRGDPQDVEPVCHIKIKDFHLL